MSALSGILQSAKIGMPFDGWTRAEVSAEVWSTVSQFIASGDADLLALWSDRRGVYLATMERKSAQRAIVSLNCPDGHFPSVARFHAPAQRLERTVRDLYGLVPQDAPDKRSWLDHGRWVGQPGEASAPHEPYEFLLAEGAPLHQIPVGPVHAGIIEPGHFRFSCNGETVVRLEERLGYVHKGVERLMQGKSVEQSGRIAARVSGDSTVAYSFAFSRAVEIARAHKVPLRAQIIRGVMAELERIANHLGDVGSICNDAAFSIMHAQCHVVRERVLRTAADCFGHRLMMDKIVPGGVACDLVPSGVATIRDLFAEIDKALPHLVEVYDTTSSLQDRTARTGIVSRNLVEQFAAGGIVGRASGRAFDARHTPGYAPYEAVFGAPVTRTSGDVDARVWVRIDEIARSRVMVLDWLKALPEGPVLEADWSPQTDPSEGAAMVEAFRGDVFAWIKLAADGTVAHCHLRDASWFQWPLLEAAIEGNIVADFPLCNKSFNCSYSGHDI